MLGGGVLSYQASCLFCLIFCFRIVEYGGRKQSAISMQIASKRHSLRQLADDLHEYTKELETHTARGTRIRTSQSNRRGYLPSRDTIVLAIFRTCESSVPHTAPTVTIPAIISKTARITSDQNLETV